MIAAIAGLCYLLNNRSAPFQPGSFMSSELGLDLAYPSAAAAVAASSTTATAVAGAASSTTATTAVAVPTTAYATVNNVDMSGVDIPPDASNPGTLNQPTYAATGCQAICSSNNKCMAAVFQPSTQLCWMKSAIVPASITAASDRTLLLQATPIPTGNTDSNMQFTTGIEAFKIPVPTLDDCSALCQGLPRSVCQGVTFDPDKTCHIKSMASGLITASLFNSWLKSGSS